MGTTSQKGEYLNTTKSLLKQAINNLGGSIDENTTFRNYANQLQNVYDNLPKTAFQEGTDVTIENGLKGKLDFEDDNGKKKVSEGNTKQESTNGYQLWGGFTFSKNSDGVAYKQNEDGSISANGTATSESSANILVSEARTNGIYKTLPAGNYIVSGGGTGYKIQIYNTSATQIAQVSSGGTSQAFTLSAETEIIVRVLANNGAVFNNAIIKVMLETGSTAHTWEEYSGGYASPSPNWKQPIEYVRGWNLFNKDQATEIYYYNDSGERTPRANEEFEYVNQEYNLRGAVTISFTSRSAGSAYVRVCEYNGSTFIKRTLVSASGTYPLSTNCDRVIFSVDNSESVYFTNLQIEQGSTAHSYLPYNTIEEVVRGINELDYITELKTNFKGLTSVINDDGSITTTGVPTSNYVGIIDFDITSLLEIGETYSISQKNGGNQYLYMQINATNTQTSQSSYYLLNNDASKTFTAQANTTYLLRLQTGTTENWGAESRTITNSYQLKKGSVSDFEPYITPTTYQLSLGNQKFYSIGTYADELLYDVDEDKVYKNEKIGELVLNGTENWVNSGQYGYPNVFFVENIFDNILTNSNRTMLSTNFKYGGAIESSSLVEINKFYMWKTLPYRLILGIDYTQVSQLTNWLNSNNVSIYYQKATPTLTEITDTTLKAQVKAWYYAQSNNDTTIIEGNGDLPMIIKVRSLKAS